MARDGLVGESLLGLPRTQRPPNTHGIGRYLFVLLVAILGCIYAAPNLYQPDPALQIKSTSDDYAVETADLERAEAALKAAGIAVSADQIDAGVAVIRLSSKEDQLRGRDLVNATLNDGDREYVVALNQASTTPQWLRDMGGRPMSLGLDLSGGVHFLLQVDMNKFIGDRLDSTEESVRDTLVKARIRYERGSWIKNGGIEIGFPDEARRDQALELVGEDQLEGVAVDTREVNGKPGIRMAFTEQYLTSLEDLAVQQNVQSLKQRVNELGVAEPLVQRLGRQRIVLDLPGVQDSARAKEIINKFATLEFRLVANEDARVSQTETYDYEGSTVTLNRANIVTGDRVVNAQQDFDPETQAPQVSITLDNDGGNRMHANTKDNIGRPMAIIFKELKVRFRTVEENGEQVQKPYTVEDRRVISVATIQAALGFRFRITGLGLGEARDLALLLRAGALAAPMYIVEERTVGASLGDENIKQGRIAIQIGLSAVLVFMLFYYKAFGLAANVALVLNIVLITAIMSLLGATLTMPGIAGIVLTVGMAVDANVLIFSRIREELKDRSPQQAIQAGFDRALLTILDANITTFLVAIILFSVGSGPVRGFAVTLAVGIVTSVFTAVMVTRAIVNLMCGGRKLQKVWI